jgi:hypothetical protein
VAYSKPRCRTGNKKHQFAIQARIAETEIAPQEMLQFGGDERLY